MGISLIQPLDNGIIKILKRNYRKKRSGILTEGMEEQVQVEVLTRQEDLHNGLSTTSPVWMSIFTKTLVYRKI